MSGGGACDKKAQRFLGRKHGSSQGRRRQVRAGLWVVASAALAPPVAAANDGERPARILYFEPLHVLPAPSGDCAAESRRLRAATALRRLRPALRDFPRLERPRSWRASPQQSQLELYRGSIDGIAGSWVRLATKGDALHGMMWDGAQLYAIEPASEVRDALDQRAGRRSRRRSSSASPT